MTFGQWKNLCEIASYVTIVLGFPIAIIEYRRKTKKEQQDREYGTYNALDEKYLEFQRMCFDHPRLDIFDIPDGDPTRKISDTLNIVTIWKRGIPRQCAELMK